MGNDSKLGSVTIPRELFDFLMGAGEIDGTSFGDLNARLPGRFWWRALLRTAEQQAPEIEMRTVLELIARRNGAWSQLARAALTTPEKPS